MFNKVGALRPKRHFFNKSFVYKTTMKFGELIPFVCEEVVPGDKYKIGNNAVVRVSPMVAPILDNIYLRTEYFFVPDRIVANSQEDFTKFLTGGDDGTYTTYPFGKLERDDDVPRSYFDGSISDYLGLPRHWENLGPTDKVDITDKFHRAYIKVYNEFYRDENLQTEVEYTTDYFFKPLKRNWKKDYFTSALLAPLRGSAPSVPIQGILPVFGAPADLKFGPYDSTIGPNLGSPSGTFTSATRLFSNSGDVGGYMTTAINNVVPGASQNDYYSKQNEVEGKRVGFIDKDPEDSYSQKVRGLRINPVDMNLYASMRLSDGIGFNAADIRKLMQVQKFLERNMRAGALRLNEFLLAHFGVSPRDEVLQRPRFLGSTKTPILISEVLQTSESTSNSPQGRLSGKGLGLSAGMIGYHSFEEPGVVIGLVSIIPDLSYQSQGINRKFTRFTKYDYYFAEFAHLTEQPIKKYELMFDTQSTGGGYENLNNKTFGYQGIYDDMRHNRDIVTGQFRSDSATSLDYWHLARFFYGVPALNSDFITCEPSNRIFEVQDEPPFQVCIGNILKAIRPMPAIAEPGLVDHF